MAFVIPVLGMYSGTFAEAAIIGFHAEKTLMSQLHSFFRFSCLTS
jgi:hypothetical protein